jgi:hypothetical protein
VGLRGEREVARLLQELEAEGYRVLHDVQTAGGTVDHVVIGRSGVCAVETKAWAGRFHLGRGGSLLRNGFDASSLVRQAVGEAKEIRSRLSRAGMDSWVTAIVALTRAQLPKGPITSGYATVMLASEVPAFIRSRWGRLSEHEVERAAKAISRAERVSARV